MDDVDTEHGFLIVREGKNRKDRAVPIGARLMVTYLKDDGNVAGKSEPFAEGWNDNGYYLGRPVDVAQLADGSLLVSDDLVGALYRIWYDGK